MYTSIKSKSKSKVYVSLLSSCLTDDRPDIQYFSDYQNQCECFVCLFLFVFLFFSFRLLIKYIYLKMHYFGSDAACSLQNN